MQVAPFLQVLSSTAASSAIAALSPGGILMQAATQQTINRECVIRTHTHTHTRWITLLKCTLYLLFMSDPCPTQRWSPVMSKESWSIFMQLLESCWDTSGPVSLSTRHFWRTRWVVFIRRRGALFLFVIYNFSCVIKVIKMKSNLEKFQMTKIFPFKEKIQRQYLSMNVSL